MRLQVHMSEPGYPRQVWEAWEARRIMDEDLVELLPYAWLYSQEPERVLATARWVTMFRAAGFLLLPTNLGRPTTPLRAFRGATEARMTGMAWYLDRRDAAPISKRHARFGEAHIYVTTVPLEAMLAHLQRADEGPEIIVDPQLLGEIVQSKGDFA